MLLQSHRGRLKLLPALPRAWLKGKVSGLRARGGFEVDLAWSDGKLERVSVLNLAGESAGLVYGKTSLALRARKGSRLNFEWRDEKFMPA